MYWRGAEPTGHGNSLYSVAAILIFIWLLAAIDIYDGGAVATGLLAVATALIAIAMFRRA